MITAGLTQNDLKVLDMDLNELKKYQDSLLEELSELNEVLKAVGKDPGMIFSETINRVDTYFEDRDPKSPLGH